jgi:hypothetical protein
MLVMLVFGVLVTQALAQDEPPACSIAFRATVRLGESTGTALKGTMEFSLDETGALVGLLKQDDQPDIPVVGQVVGRAINLVIDISTAENPGLLIFGNGTALDPFDAGTCGTILGGGFVGPMEGDSGDWVAGYAIGGKSGTGGSLSSVIWGT